MRLEFLAPATLVLFACFAQAKENPSAPETEQVSAPLAWREAVRSAQLLLLQASSTMADMDEPDAKSRFPAAIMGLCRLEAKIDHYLAALEQPP